MTLLASKVTFYYRCRSNSEHTFERPSNDARFCPTCSGVVYLYGLKDSTRYVVELDDRPEDSQQPPK